MIRRMAGSGIRGTWNVSWHTIYLLWQGYGKLSHGAVADTCLRTDRPIALVGLMGAGKTTTGRRLAVRLRVPFHDSDEEIEQAAECPIPEIFERFGEDEFRKGECRVIRRLLRNGPGVVATGGGAFVNDETRRHIRELAVSVWLRADIDVLLARVAHSDNRPLLREGRPRDVMERLIGERYPVYAQADIVVDSVADDQDVVVSRIVSGLEELQRHD